MTSNDQTQNVPAINQIDAALDAFVAVPMSDEEQGRVLAEVVEQTERVREEVMAEMLPGIDEAIDVAEMLLSESKAADSAQRDEGKVDDIRARLAELDDVPEE